MAARTIVLINGEHSTAWNVRKRWIGRLAARHEAGIEHAQESRHSEESTGLVDTAFSQVRAF
jgi:hypothetical protein